MKAPGRPAHGGHRRRPCLPGPKQRPTAVHRAGSTAGPAEMHAREVAALVSKARQHLGAEPPAGHKGTLSGRRRDIPQRQ